MYEGQFNTAAQRRLFKLIGSVCYQIDPSGSFSRHYLFPDLLGPAHVCVCVCSYTEAECLTGENISEIFVCTFFARRVDGENVKIVAICVSPVTMEIV